ncbi:leucine-rich repeat and iq domain-containing protein 3 [Plakobranchus ocellatus]|uniref:Leucine-rich repeat and iq domain-containing protein 3 n=1 Tax=Plakobranchus ocellatus TaxID=259542 RepID=A0AAV4D6U6_9GAST|nr:leucine-rich repeat and iq domain-containing protein 3 [Plakobranchus ocellatus]
MVSIPDWARFAQLTDNKQNDKQSLLSKFYKQKELEAVKLAEQHGYFLEPTEKELLIRCKEQNPETKNISEFELVRLRGVHLRVLGDIGACTRLTICLLSNNFITKMDSLIACRQLIKLDLHSNQLTSVPGSPFWASLRRLQCLNLHDNPLGKFETLQILGSSPSLTMLTLYDTPLSLKKNYRHHVVNSIWTLKALDMHVISDEEIIEDAVFNGHFKALTPPFRIDLCPHTPSNFTFQQEMAVFDSINVTINKILAKHSPVLIVQRYIRGFLLRRRMGIVQHIKDSASIPSLATPIILRPEGGEDATDVAAREGMDYDTYLRFRRPGSIQWPTEGVRAPRSSAREHKDEIALTALGESQDLSNAATVSQDTPLRLHVNVQKLDSGTLSGLQAASAAMETALAETDHTGLAVKTSRRHRGKRKEKGEGKKDERLKPQRIKDVKQFFGPVVPAIATDVGEAEEEDEDEIPMTDFRLKGRKPQLLVADATTEMILGRREAGQMVREAEAERIKKEAEKLPVKATPHNFTTNEQRIFHRTHATMGLSCLMAVHKAYKDREKAEKMAAKMENILGMREERQRAKDRISLYHDERRAQVLRARDMDRARIIDRLEKRELQRLNFLDKQQEYKVRSSDVNKSIRTEQSFMLEFNSQHTSVSNALLRHDRQAKHEDSRNNRRKLVSEAKMGEVEQQDVVRSYLEHRRLMRQTETAMARAALDTKMLSEANDRLQDARSRVAHQRARQASVQAFYPLPPHNMPPATTAPAGMSRWEATSSGLAGRVGRHHTIFT